MPKQRDWVPLTAHTLQVVFIALFTAIVVVSLHGAEWLQYALLVAFDIALVWVFSDNTSHSDV